MIYASLKHKDKELLRRARKAAIDVKYQPDSFFSRPAGSAVVHQGLMARLSPFKYCSLEALLTPESECVLVLDEIVDPRNLGALLRSAESCSVDGVILTNRRSAKISPAAEKAAAGAAETRARAALEEADAGMASLMEELGPRDLLVITADHGNDPTTPSTDHSRERVPLLCWAPGIEPVELGVRSSFADLGQTVAANWSLTVPHGTSFLDQLRVG